MPTETPIPSSNPTLTEPLDVSPISMYKLPGTNEKGGGEEEATREEMTTEKEEGTYGVDETVKGAEAKTEETPIERGMGEKVLVEEEQLNETAKKQGLMTDEEFQTLLDRVRHVECDTAGMAEGPDLASQAVEGEISEKAMEKPDEVTAQPGEEAEIERGIDEEPRKVVNQPEVDTIPVGETKSVKRKLVLKDDPKVKNQLPMRTTRRRPGRGVMKKSDANKASKAVEISSGEEGDSPTKPEEDPKAVTAKSEAGQASKLALPDPTAQEESGTTTKPGGIPTTTPSQSVQEVTVEAQQANSTAQEEPSASKGVKSESKDEEARY